MNSNRTSIYGYIFVLPALFFISVFLLYPVIRSFIYSLYSWDGLTEPTFRGIKNWVHLITKDDIFRLAIKNTFLYSLLSVTGIVGIGFFLAVIIERRMYGWQISKFVWFLPVVLSQTVVSILWSKFYDPTSGIVNNFFGFIGLEGLQKEWIGDPDVVMFSVSFVSIWQYAGYAMILLLAALEEIPPEIHDAADIDGAGPFRRIFCIMLPMIRHVFSIVLMLIFINSLKTFDSIYVLTAGGPGDSSTVFSIHLYKTAFKYYQFGYGSVIASVIFIMLFIISTLYQRLLRFESDV